MGVAVSEAFARALSPLYSESWISGLKEARSDWQKLFDVRASKRAKEYTAHYTGLGHAVKTGQMEPVYFDSPHEVGETTWTHVKWALGAGFSKELIDDSLHVNFVREAPRWIARALMLRAELEATAVFNHAYDAGAHALFDGVALCGDHVMVSGDTLSNYASVGSAPSETALNAALSHFSAQLIDQRGLPAILTPRLLVCHPSKVPAWRKVLETDKEPGTNNNDINTVKGALQIVPLRGLTSTTGFFVVASPSESGLRVWWRQKPQYDSAPDFKRQGYLVLGSMRISVGPTDFLGVYGNPGA